jgi:PAS domain S-box-containing protein
MPDRITHDILAEIVEIAADAVICMDAFQRVTYFNRGAEGIFGYKSEEIVGERIEVLIPERYRSNHARQVAEFGRSGVTARRMGERREIAGLRKSGEEFPAEAAISQVHHGDGEVIYAVVLRDVSIRKRFEQRESFLAEAGEKLAASFGSTETLTQVARLAVPAIADACILENRVSNGFQAGATAHVDPAVEEIMDEISLAGARVPPGDHPLTEILARRAPVLIQTNAVARLLAASSMPSYLTAIKAMQPQSALFLPLVAREQLIGALCLFRGKGGFDGDDLAFAEDLARLTALALDNARLHDTVRSSLRARDEMMGVVSHDLRNPVAAVKMLSNALLGGLNGQSEARESIGLIAQAAEQMDALIRDLLDVNRLDSGQLSIARSPIEPSVLLTDSLQTLRPLVEAKGIHLDLQIETGLPKVSADRERIQQTLSNLVGNAIKFSPAGSKIVVIARRESDAVVFSVLDRGKGIASHELPKVFDRYWQSSRTDRQGAGLGLAISKGIIETHGGRIWLESAPGAGTTASFSLPFIDGDPA